MTKIILLSLSRIAIANTGVAVHTTHFTRQDACQCKIYILKEYIVNNNKRNSKIIII